MAIKRRPADEDDEERPRRKRRRDEEDEDEEDEDRPQRRRSKDEEADEDDEDRPVKRRRSRDDDDEEEDEDRPAKRRRSRDEDEEDEEDDDRPRKRRKARDEEGEDDDDEPSPKKGARKDEKSAEAEPDDDEAAYEAWLKKKAQTRKQYLAVQAGLGLLQKRVNAFLGSLAGLIGMCGLTWLMVYQELMGEDIVYFIYVVDLTIIIFGVYPPALGIQAANKCKLGPEKINGDGYLNFETIISIVIMAIFVILAMFVVLVVCAVIDDRDVMLWGGLSGLGLGYFAYMVSFVNELLYLKVFAKFMKDKLQLPRASSAITHFINFGFVAVPIVGTAGYFLSSTSLGMVGKVLTAVLAAVWLLALFKGIMDTKRIAEALGLTINKKLAAEDKPNW